MIMVLHSHVRLKTSTDVLGLGLLQVDLQQLQLSQASVALELRRLRGMLTSLTGMDRKVSVVMFMDVFSVFSVMFGIYVNA